MVFSLPEFTFGTAHRMKGVQRKLFKLPPDSFLKRATAPVTAAIDPQTQKPRVCHLCGYFLAEVKTKDGWQVSACSATELKYLLRAQTLLEEHTIELRNRDPHHA